MIIRLWVVVIFVILFFSWIVYNWRFFYIVNFSNSSLVILLLHHYFSLDVFQWVLGYFHAIFLFLPHRLFCEPCFYLSIFQCAPTDFRGNWEISRRDLNSTHLVSMVPSDQNLTTSNYDQYSASATGSLICCRSIAVIVTSLLLCMYATMPLHLLVMTISKSSLLLCSSWFFWF